MAVSREKMAHWYGIGSQDCNGRTVKGRQTLSPSYRESGRSGMSGRGGKETVE